jgi:hypothetical protein
MKSLLPPLILALAATACGSEPSASEISHVRANDVVVEPGTFRLFVTPGGPQDVRCSFYTDLTLDAAFQSPMVTLENGVVGTCDVLVNPHRRAWSVGVTVDSCNTKHLVADGIEVLDHRERTCKDVVPAKIILKERDETGLTTTLYSDDQPAQEDQIATYQGSLQNLMAIGGETTGYGLQLADGRIVELDLRTNGFENLFVDGARFEVTGRMTTVQGVEIPTRKVLVVTSMTAL